MPMSKPAKLQESAESKPIEQFANIFRTLSKKCGNFLTRNIVDVIVEHAKQLVTVSGHSSSPAIGLEMEDLRIVEDGAVALDDGKIVAVGRTSEVLAEYSGAVNIDASNKIVTPGFVDAHTHFVFAGSRETELELKIKGAGYLEILQRGGGIFRTVRDTRAASKDELIRICEERRGTSCFMEQRQLKRRAVTDASWKMRSNHLK